MQSEIHSFKITRTKMYLNTKSTKCDCLIHTYSHVPNRGDSSWEISVKRLPRSSLQCIYCIKKIEISAPKLNHSHHDEKTGIGAAHCMKRAFFSGKNWSINQIRQQSRFPTLWWYISDIIFTILHAPCLPFWPVAMEDSQKRPLIKNPVMSF